MGNPAPFDLDVETIGITCLDSEGSRSGRRVSCRAIRPGYSSDLDIDSTVIDESIPSGRCWSLARLSWRLSSGQRSLIIEMGPPTSNPGTGAAFIRADAIL